MKSNLAPSSPEKLNALHHITKDLIKEVDVGAVFWSQENGYELKIPTPAPDQTLPIPLYLLGLCFMRLSTDPNFGNELINWAGRHQN